MKLASKVAIVTGGSRGIGLAIATALGLEGAKVVVASRSADELAAAQATLRDKGIEARSAVANVADLDSVNALVSDTLARWGQIDVLVNNAGVNGAIGRLEEGDAAEWREVFAINVFGTMHMCRAVLPGMRARRQGRIINLAGGGVGGPRITPRVSAYASSKAAVVQLTECLAREVVADEVYVNAISPGAIATRMTEGVIEAGPDRAGRELFDRTVKEREGGGDSPDAAARLVVWLASTASGTLTGKLLSAKWDKPGTIDIDAANRSSLYALRRVDGTMFEEVRS